jgi:cell division protease FtsH
MIKRLIKLLSDGWGDELLRKSIVNLSIYAVVLSAFAFLTMNNMVTSTPVRFAPARYQQLPEMAALDLEGQLRSKQSDIEKLVVFPDVPSVIVFRKGFEQDRIVRQADADELRKLAAASALPVVEEASEAYTALSGRLSFYWWAGAFILLFWGLWLVFRRRDDGQTDSRFKVLWLGVEGGFDRANALIQARRWAKHKFWLSAWIALATVYGGLALSGALTNQQKMVLPKYIESATTSPEWQMRRYIEENPREIQRAVIARATTGKAVYLVIKTAKPVTTVSYDGDGEATSSSASTLERKVLFTPDAAGERALAEFTAMLAARKIASKHADTEITANFFEKLTPAGATISVLMLSLLVVGGFAIGNNWSDWKEEAGPTASKRAVTAGGGKSVGKADNGLVVIEDKDRKSFDDIHGQDEAVGIMRTTLRKIMHRDQYTAFHAPPPKGIMMYGDPGNGKTLLAKVIAGETGGAFFMRAGSDFVNKYVGVGADAVRNTVRAAKAAFLKTGKLSIIFIDEIDAIGKKRSSESEGGNREYEQTLNEILVQMDGIGSQGIVWVAATNRMDILDPALTRSGRFEVHIQVLKPDRKGRRAIFAGYLRKIRLAVTGNAGGLSIEEVREQILDICARRSYEFSGADIEFAVKEACTVAAERNFETVKEMSPEEIAKIAAITPEDVAFGIDKVRFGTLLTSRTRQPGEKLATAKHEIGHAAIPTIMGGDPVTFINIQMTSKSLGLMENVPEEDVLSWSKNRFLIKIVTLLAGRAAEEILAGEISTGASNDFERASQLARQMVGIYGMSDELGVASLPLDRYGFPVSNVGEAMLGEFNGAWRKIVAECNEQARGLIEKYKNRINFVAYALYEEEKLSGEQFRDLWNEPRAEIFEEPGLDGDGNIKNRAVTSITSGALGGADLPMTLPAVA